MLERLSPTRRNLALLLLAALFAWFAWSIRSVLNPLMLGYLCAFILHPLVERIERLGLSRRTAVNLTFVGGFLLASAILLGLALQIRSLAIEVYESATVEDRPAVDVEEPPLDLQQRLQARLDEFSGSLKKIGIDLGPIQVPDMSQLQELASEFLREHGDQAAGAGLRGVRFLLAFLGRLLKLAGLFILLPLYTYYFLFELERINAFVRRHLPRSDRARLARVGERIGRMIASFFRGRLSVAFLKGAFLALGLWVAQIDYALLFGMLTGVLSIVPFIGSLTGFVLALVVGILDHGVWGSLLRTGIVFGLGEILEGYVLIPKILGSELRLHPMVVIAAILAGGAAGGIFGVLVALPVTAAIVILVEEFVLPALRDFADEKERAPPPKPRGSGGNGG